MPTSITFAIILDIILIAVLVVTMLRYRKKGFIAGILDLVGNLAALAFAWIVSDKVSPGVFENFFKSGLITSTANTIQEQGTFNITHLLDTLSGILPQKLIESITLSTQDLLGSGAPDLAQQIVEKVIAPLVVPIITVVVFFATYALCKLLIAFLVATLTNINRIPLVGSVNRTLGMVTGLFAGTINILLILCLIWAIVAITSGSMPFLNDEILSGSWFYAAFSKYNPFL